MGLDPGNTHRAAAGGLSETNVKAFAEGLNGALAPDVRVQLYACSTAQGGSDSLAAHLAQDLGKGASVYGHTVSGDAVENAQAAVFGKDAGAAGPQGLAMFDMMFPADYQTAELMRLFPTDEKREARRTSLRSQMRACYAAATRMAVTTKQDAKDPTKQDPVFEGATTANVLKRHQIVGDEMFADPDNARTWFHAYWTDTWAPQHLKEIRPDKSWKPPATPAAQ